MRYRHRFLNRLRQGYLVGLGHCLHGLIVGLALGLAIADRLRRAWQPLARWVGNAAQALNKRGHQPSRSTRRHPSARVTE